MKYRLLLDLTVWLNTSKGFTDWPLGEKYYMHAPKDSKPYTTTVFFFFIFFITEILTFDIDLGTLI